MEFKACKYLVHNSVDGAREVSGWAVGGLPYRLAVHLDEFWNDMIVSDWDTGTKVAESRGNNKPKAIREALALIEQKSGEKAYIAAQRKHRALGLYKPDMFITGARNARR